MSAGRFVPGQSGNAAGRPRDPFKARATELANALIERALSGDPDALQTAVRLAFETRRQMKAGGGHQI